MACSLTPYSPQLALPWGARSRVLTRHHCLMMLKVDVNLCNTCICAAAAGVALGVRELRTPTSNLCLSMFTCARRLRELRRGWRRPRGARVTRACPPLSSAPSARAAGPAASPLSRCTRHCPVNMQQRDVKEHCFPLCGRGRNDVQPAVPLPQLQRVLQCRHCRIVLVVALQPSTAAWSAALRMKISCKQLQHRWQQLPPISRHTDGLQSQAAIAVNQRHSQNRQMKLDGFIWPHASSSLSLPLLRPLVAGWLSRLPPSGQPAAAAGRPATMSIL